MCVYENTTGAGITCNLVQFPHIQIQQVLITVIAVMHYKHLHAFSE